MDGPRRPRWGALMVGLVAESLPVYPDGLGNSGPLDDRLPLSQATLVFGSTLCATSAPGQSPREQKQLGCLLTGQTRAFAKRADIPSFVTGARSRAPVKIPTGEAFVGLVPHHLEVLRRIIHVKRRDRIFRILKIRQQIGRGSPRESLDAWILDDRLVELLERQVQQ